MLMTGGKDRWLRGPVGRTQAESQAALDALWWPPTKIASRRLAPYLLGREQADRLSAPVAGAQEVERHTRRRRGQGGGERRRGARRRAALLREALDGELRETHISWVVLAGDRAFKIKKPLLLPFLDYSTLERRRALCHEEVRLNRRLAPDVYRGVRAIVIEAGVARIEDERAADAVEYAVEMRRYDEGSTLANRLATGDAGERELRDVGTRLAAFHAGARVPPRPQETVAALDAMLAENFASLRELLPGDGRVEAAAALATAVLQGRRDELRRRAAAGLVRDGHGDLRAEHVVLEHGIEIVDCVEFDAALREQDVALDLAFLVMDVMRRDERLGPRAARRLSSRAEATPETIGSSTSSPHSAR